MKLLTTKQHKLDKSLKRGYATCGISLSPANESVPFGGVNLCPNAGSCAAHCLKTAGRNKMPTHIETRVNRTLMLLQARAVFERQLEKELSAFVRKCEREGMTPTARPNILSDQPRLAHIIHQYQPDMQLYDYTKIPKPWLRTGDKYHLTYSLDTHNEREAVAAMMHGINVAVVFDPDEPLPKSFKLGKREYPTVDGDVTDLRFLDPPGHIVALRGKKTVTEWRGAVGSGFYRSASA